MESGVAVTPRVYTVAEAARTLGMCEATVRTMVKDGRIRAIRFGRLWRISQAEMERLVAHGANGKE